MNQVFPAYKSAAVDSLIPYAKNSRTHSAAQISKIAQSIKEFGFLNPVIVDGKNGIVAGHGRVLAAKQLGMTEVPVVEAGHLTEAQRRAYVIADNRLALDAGWDDAILKVEIGELQGLGFDLKLTGFEIGEIGDILAGSKKNGLSGSLAATFGVPPFSVLRASEGWWQERKQAWLALGIQSELGRGEGDRAAPGGSVMPGQGSRKNYRLGDAKA
jgi:hypothetical protein